MLRITVEIIPFHEFKRRTIATVEISNVSLSKAKTQIYRVRDDRGRTATVAHGRRAGTVRLVAEALNALEDHWVSERPTRAYGLDTQRRRPSPRCRGQAMLRQKAFRQRVEKGERAHLGKC